MKKLRALKECARVMTRMLEIGFTKRDLPKLERLFWKVRDHRTGELKNPKPIIRDAEAQG